MKKILLSNNFNHDIYLLNLESPNINSSAS